MVSAHAPNLVFVHGDAEAAQVEGNGRGDESRPLLDQIRRETFGERRFRHELPTTLLDQAHEQMRAPINFYLSNSDSAPKETKAAYEIPEENRLGTWAKFFNYTTSACAFSTMALSGASFFTKSPWIQAGMYLVGLGAGLKYAEYSIHGQELKDLKIKESVLFPK